MVESKRTAPVAAPGMKQRLLVLALIAAAAGGGAWFVLRAQGQIADKCLDDLLDVRMASEARELSLEAIATGTLKIQGESEGATGLRIRITAQDSFLPGLAECRRIHYLGGEPSPPIELTGDLLVGISQTGDLGMNGDPHPTGVRMTADNAKFGECKTDHRGRCYLPFQGVNASETVTVLSDFEGASSQSQPASRAIGQGVHFTLERRGALQDILDRSSRPQR